RMPIPPGEGSPAPQKRLQLLKSRYRLRRNLVRKATWTETWTLGCLRSSGLEIAEAIGAVATEGFAALPHKNKPGDTHAPPPRRSSALDRDRIPGQANPRNGVNSKPNAQ